MRKQAYVIGIGTGSSEYLTLMAERHLEKAELIIGARRMINAVQNHKAVKICSYKPDEIHKYLHENDKYSDICILCSGDVGFFSAASSLKRELDDYDLKFVPGISSIVYFSSKLHMSWDNMDILSSHGMKANIIGHIMKNKKTFAILSGPKDLKELAEKIIRYNMKDIIIHVGENLSYDKEKIYHLKPEDVSSQSFGKLLAVIIENKGSVRKPYIRIKDEDFIRDETPMTKEEIRTICISKLELDKNSVLYDVGAGTGSISVQAAVNYDDCRVYAFEKKEDACALIEKNKNKFAADNITVIKGNAPEAFKGLEAPTNMFIGGSSGNMREIIEWAVEKNPGITIVITAVSLETLSETMKIIKDNSIDYEVALVNVSKSRRTGNYNLMCGQNPVYIITIKGDL